MLDFQQQIDKFFQDNDRGYPRDPRKLAYKKLQKNTQGMDREQIEAFVTANLTIPHSQYKMALGNLIQFLRKYDDMNKLNEVKQFQKIAGLLNENWHPDDPAGVDLDDIEDRDPEDFDDISEDDDYDESSDSESEDTDAMGGINEKSSKVEHFYGKIIGAIEKVSKRLDDDSVHELHEKLKAFFNKTI